MQLAKLTIFILSLASQVLGWGDLGHRTVALVAQKYLTPETQQLLDSILENTQGYDFSDAAVWADTIKTKRPYTKPWHYIGISSLPSVFQLKSKLTPSLRRARLPSEAMRPQIPR